MVSGLLIYCTQGANEDCRVTLPFSRCSFAFGVWIKVTVFSFVMVGFGVLKTLFKVICGYYDLRHE